MLKKVLENKLMGKIRNLLNKLKKKKKSQDLDEIFYDQDHHDELDQEIGEETVIFDEGDQGHELRPHPTSGEPNIPAKSNLQFPQNKSDAQSPSEPDYEPTREIQFDQIPELETDQEVDEIYDETQTNVLSESDFEEHGSDFDFEDIEEEFDEIQQLAEDDARKEIDQEDGYEYTFADKTFTSEIDLDNDKITLKDKLDHLGTRIVDRFRNINKKDLNQALKPPSKAGTRTNIQIEKLKTKVSEVQWNKFIDRVLNPQKNQSIHHYFQISIALFLVYLLGHGIGSFIKGKPDYANSGKGSAIIIDTDQVIQNSDLDRVKTADLFKTSQKVQDTKPIQTRPKVLEKCLKAETKSSLPIKLFHTIVLQDSVKSIASVSVRSSKVKHIREGEKIQSLAKVDKIDRLELIVRNMQTGLCESIQSSEMKNTKTSNPIKLMSKSESKAYTKQQKEIKGISNNGNDYVVERAVLQEKMQDINSLLKQARAIPINNPDGTISFKIVEIEPDSVFSALGIENGDIISSIGGEPIQNYNQVMGMFGKITNLNNLKLGLSREGEPVEKSYTIK